MLYEINEKTIRLEHEGKRIIKFNLGDPDQSTPHAIVEAAFDAIKQGKTKYASSAGEKNLREAIGKIHDVSADHVIITPGSKWAIFSVMYLLLKRGDNVVIPAPSWTAYRLVIKNLGVAMRYLRTELESAWKIDVDKLQDLVDERTKLIILNSPNNPTSQIIEDDVLTAIVQIANDAGIPILSDEVYSDISFDSTKSILEFEGNHILVQSFSKTFAMTGWRIGYVILDSKVADMLMKLNQMTLTNVPVFVQAAALKALELKSQIAEAIREEYARRADLACRLLSKTKLKFAAPAAPFYVFPKYDGLDSETFAWGMLNEGVAVAPGTAFGDYREHFRIALTVQEAEIESGLNKICAALERK